jgi:hypothetical protein
LTDDAVDLSTTPLRDRDAAEPLIGQLDASGQVTVEIIHEPGRGRAVRDEVDRLNGEVLGSSPGVVLVTIAPAAVRALERRPGVEYVRSPLRVDLVPDPVGEAASSQATTDVHIALTNASTWHAAGFHGVGVKVGIVDFFDGAAWTTAQASGDVPVPAGTFCRNVGFSCDLWSFGSSHGVAVGEVIYDMAPGTVFYLATVGTVTDLAAAVTWFDEQGVEIISRSLGEQLDGPGDGTGSVDAVVDDAVNRGMLWLNSAGNHASVNGSSLGGYWRGGFNDVDADGWMEFAPGDENLGFFCGLIQGFRWSDWAEGGRTDYDIDIYSSTGLLLASSFSDQTTGAPPLELIEPGSINCTAFPVVFLQVQLFHPGSGTSGDKLEFMVNGTLGFEYSSNPYSASGPAADSANPGMLTVGAIDPPSGTAIASYSSQGPTNDERTKPDLSAPSCLATVSFSPGCFAGTSAATPVVAGAAALVWGAASSGLGAELSVPAGTNEVTTTPASVAQYLRTHVIDRGAPGTDPIYGSGQLLLGDPPGALPTVSIADAGPVSEGGTAEFSVTLSAASSDEVTVNYATANNNAFAPGDYTAKSGVVTFTPGDIAETITVTTKTDGDQEETESFFVDLTAPVNAALGDAHAVGTINDTTPGNGGGDDIHTVGLVDPTTGEWHLYGPNGAEVATFFYGNPGDFPIMGDWDCDGDETPGLYRQADGFVYLRNANTQGNAHIRFFFGNPGDIPLAGDFNDDGCDTVSIYRPSEGRVFIINELGENDGGLGAADLSYFFGNPGDKPFVGDFNGNGTETIGLHRETTGLVYFRNTHTQGNADNQFIYGNPGDRLVAGDWTGDSTFSPALFRPSTTTTFFRFTNTQGNADHQWTAGDAPWLPVAGHTGLS